MIHITDKILAHGYYEIISLENGREVWRSPVMPNRILDAAFETIVDHHNGDTTNPLEITTIEIGDGTAAVQGSDTALDNAVTTGIPVGRTITAGLSVTKEFFITDGELPDGTYTEVGIKAGSILWARSLFTSAYTKVSGRDTIVRYTLTYGPA